MALFQNIHLRVILSRSQTISAHFLFPSIKAKPAISLSLSRVHILSKAQITNRCGSVPFPTSVVQSVRVQAMTRAGSAHLYSTRELSHYRNNAILDKHPEWSEEEDEEKNEYCQFEPSRSKRSPSESNTPHSKLPSALVVLVRYE